ncbi:pseudouridine synthase [Sessilibacter sp. MAH2]
MPPIEIVFQDPHLLVVNKPANLLTVPGKGPEKQDCLINRMLKTHPNSRVVHRLDMATSGLVILPQNQTSLSKLARSFQDREIHKEYIAVVEGCVELEHGFVEQPLICDWPNRPKQMIHSDGKHALTEYHRLEQNKTKNQSRLLLKPVTGRSHQLRVHTEFLGHPILGDSLYGTESSRAQSDRLLLHAQRIQFKHPVYPGWITLTCRAPF